MKSCLRLILIMLCSPLAAAPAAVQLKPGVPVLVPAGTPAAVRLAVEDLRRDLQKVFGQPSPIVSDVADLQGRNAIVVAGAGRVPAGLHHADITGLEAHGIHVRALGDTPHVVLEGADPRGAIYAIYSFSDEFLGVPPLWYWADWKPVPRDAIAVPVDTARIFTPAYVRWRAWFNNDTDFLSPWRNRSAENDQAVYETALRLKYNTYEVGSVANLSANAPRFAVNRDAAGAHARGLMITHHHTSPLGSNLGSWDAFWRREGKPVPPLAVESVENLKAFWRYHVETSHRAGLEVIWTLVFRGSRDIPFWETFKDAPVEAADRARVINQMLRAQVSVVKEVTGDSAPAMRTTFYNEGTTLLAAGLLQPPAEPTLIWNFVAARRDHFPTEDLRRFKAPSDRQIGYYLNFQFTSTGSHLAPAEGPWKMAANYRIVDSTGARPLAFTVVNAGNIREHLAELSANAAMMWGFREFNADEFLLSFCARYFGNENARDAARLYHDYYHAYWTQKRPDIPGFDRQYLFQDMRYARAVEMLLKDMAANTHRPNPLEGHPLDNPNTGSVGYFRVEPQPGESNQVDALLRGTTESGRKFSAVAAAADALQPRLAAQGRVFFDDNLRARARLMAQLNELLHATTRAYQAHGQPEMQREQLEAAVRALGAVQATLDSTRHGVFDHWYASDRVFGLAALHAQLTAAIARLR